MDMPELLTERLELRGFAESDLPEFAAMGADPEVMRFIGPGVPRTVEECRERLTATLYRWTQLRVPMWAVRRRGDSALLGRCGFQPLKDTDHIEIAYGFARSAWGQGYATEAARGCMDWAMAHRPWPKIVALARPLNLGSLRVLAKIGFTRVRELDWDGGAVVWHEFDVA